MESNVLQSFLDQGLLDIGEGTDKFGFLSSAATDMAEALKTDRWLLPASSSLLLGGTMQQSEPVFRRCEECITRYWPTYRSRFQADTWQLFRATLLQATSQLAADGDKSYAAIIYYTACSLLPHLPVTKEADIFRSLLIDLARAVELESSALWRRADEVLGDFKSPDAAITPGSPALKILVDGARAAAGPNPGLPGANPQWPSSNTQEWLDHFGKTLAEAVGALVTAGLKDFGSKVTGRIAEGNSALAVAVRSASSNEQRKSDLLFWKEALFSSGASTSYRELSPDSVVYWSARDLHVQVPNMHPASVEYFLRETIRAALGEKGASKLVSIEAFLGTLSEENSTGAGAHEGPTEGRWTLLDAIESAPAKKVPVQEAVERIGVPAGLTAPRLELGVWLFRDLQARRLASQK